MLSHNDFIQCSELMQGMSEDLDDWLFANGYEELPTWLCGKRLRCKLGHVLEIRM